ncbi:FadR/GntR family transcriptional regulator [Subtercola boreus]|uniref:GntR family transcriptional regulator n=1 Tax=Subtercola boreus TaxID=120213 RepID=A0A3E0WE65_9MICO|nr:FadR/GntR family transcriptional regulator [Subtercola boreus]RFA23527.1 GntR family transcriptional regulator [Subtercola boreus]RFA23921.1 GntR family transcriptional regulator [Subtercola boreus]RFA29620.1 GntR family transcriptional regulator [Subtercola boreus]
MARQSLVAMISDELLTRIVSGEFAPGSTLPGEQDLVARHDVSRVTVREAVKTLEAMGVARIERGRGTFVNPLSEWTSLEAVLRAASNGKNDATAAIQLIELRRMLETGAAELAATRITGEEIERLDRRLATMIAAHHVNDVAKFVEADLAFHDIILRASGNVFLAVLFEPLARVLAVRRTQTSRVPEIQAHAIAVHGLIVEALRSGDPERSRQAMDAHMAQTLRDLKTHVLHIA